MVPLLVSATIPFYCTFVVLASLFWPLYLSSQINNGLHTSLPFRTEKDIAFYPQWQTTEGD